MLRYLAAIGMSRYTGYKEISQWTQHYVETTEDRPVPFEWPGSDAVHLEFLHEMGAFRLIVRASITEDGKFQVYDSFPGTRPGTMTRVVDWNVGLDDDNLALIAEDKEYGNVLLIRLEKIAGLLSVPFPQSGVEAVIAYSALSVEGKVLLGMSRSEEDEQAYRDDENRRRQAIKTLREGDPDARRQVEKELELQDAMLKERLKNEDLFSVLEGFFVPVEDLETGAFLVLGEIISTDKILNPETEEWVHHLELSVMGAPLDVYIHPDDLVGMPRPGYRFLGRILMVGNIQEIS